MAYDKGSLLNRIIRNGDWEDFLSFATYLRWEKRYSMFNAALIYLQRPGALYVDTETGWEKRFSRWIRPDASPIVVVHPFGPVNFLYEYADTYGEDIPKYFENSFRDRFIEPPPCPLVGEMLPSAKRMMASMGIWYGEAQFGSRLYGVARFLPQPYTYTVGIGKEAKKVSTRYSITLNKTLTDQQRVLTIFHEIGHILCGHLPQDKENILLKTPKRDDRESMSEGQKEFEAEKVCELFSRIQGYEYDPNAYLKQYSGEWNNAEDYSLRYIADAVDKMLANWCG